MQRLAIKDQQDGMHSGEVLVFIETKEGVEELFVNRASVEKNSIPIGYPVGAVNGHFLVELPSETMRGKWRVWVEKSRVVEA